MSLLATHPAAAINCQAAATRQEKAICADPQLGALDREIADTYAKLMNNSSRRSAYTLRQSQRDFIAGRNAGFGQPGYDLRQAMERRLDALQTAAR